LQLESERVKYGVDGHVGAFEDGGESVSVVSVSVRVGMLAVDAEIAAMCSSVHVIRLCAVLIKLTIGHEVIPLQDLLDVMSSAALLPARSPTPGA
jgi:hypothetical protein